MMNGLGDKEAGKKLMAMTDTIRSMEGEGSGGKRAGTGAGADAAVETLLALTGKKGGRRG